MSVIAGPTSHGTTPRPNPWRVPLEVEDRLAGRRHAARAAVRRGDPAQAWELLEGTHVLSQPWVWPHVRSHVDMLRLAARTRDRRELVGQLVRILVAGPGSATGRDPVGNTGRATVRATQPMPLPDDVADFLARITADHESPPERRSTR